jgi:hypothetical protein
MSLDNLVKTKQLNTHVSSAAEIGRLLDAARRNVADSGVKAISAETRFDAAYKAIMQCAMVGLCANGYRPSTTTPGHHQTMILSLELTMGVPPEVWRVLDALRRKRNLNDYGGNLIEPASVAECIQQASQLLETTRAWLQAHRPEFLSEKQ